MQSTQVNKNEIGNEDRTAQRETTDPLTLLNEILEIAPKNVSDVAILQRYDAQSISPRLLSMREKLERLKSILQSR